MTSVDETLLTHAALDGELDAAGMLDLKSVWPEMPPSPPNMAA